MRSILIEQVLEKIDNELIHINMNGEIERDISDADQFYDSDCSKDQSDDEEYAPNFAVKSHKQIFLNRHNPVLYP